MLIQSLIDCMTFVIIWVWLQLTFIYYVSQLQNGALATNVSKTIDYPKQSKIWKTETFSSRCLDYSHLQCPGGFEWLILFFITSFVCRAKIGMNDSRSALSCLQYSLHTYWIPPLDARDMIPPPNIFIFYVGSLNLEIC